MKKKLLTVALAAGVLLPLSAQWTQVGGTVKVQPNTLKYVSGTHDVKGGKESNDGKVYVGGNFDVASAGEFRNEFTNPTNYGQLIINDQSTATGKVISAYKTPGYTNFAFAKMAFPFVGVSAQELVIESGVTNYVWQNKNRDKIFSRNRWKNPIFVWVNDDYVLDNLNANEVLGSNSEIQPYNYYALNNLIGNVNFRTTDYFGTPANKQYKLPLDPFEVVGPNATNRSINSHGEQLGTFIKDHFVDISYENWKNVSKVMVKPKDFGDNYFLFGNPYTSNLDLRNAIPKDGSVIGFIQESGSVFDPNDTNGMSNKGIKQPLKSTYENNDFTGDESIFIVRPYHTFGIKTNGSSNIDITLTDLNKKFDIDLDAPSYSAREIQYKNSSSGFNQVKIQLFDDEQKEVSKTYVVASIGYEAAGQAGNEAFNTDLPDNVDAIYTLQENADGTVNQEMKNSKLYINGVNENSYVGKPVYVVHQVVTPGQYEFKFNLNDKVINSTDKFFFEDRETGDVLEITDEFNYIFTASNTSDDRFAIYWNENAKLDVNDAVEVATETIVYKDNQEFKIRFAKDWTKADIFVYNILGQLVHTKKGVNASMDYTIPFNTNLSSAYIVKAVNINGEVVTKKIIK